MTEESKTVFKASKAANIIISLSDLYNIPLKEATDIFYSSSTATLIEEEVADLHCRSDKYLATLVWEEYQDSLH